MLRVDYQGKISAGEFVLLYDGICVLCESYMLFLMKRDKKKQVRFAALQSNFGQMIKEQLEEQGAQDLDSVLLIDSNGQVWVKSDVALRVSKTMSGLWPMSQILLILPRGFRNSIYDWVARNRYKWFGQKEVCEIPSAADRIRFLE